jgi:hypothetical protein
MDDLSVWGGNDALDGQAGDDIKDSGNRVSAPRDLVDCSSVAQASRSAPVIAWNGKLGVEAGRNTRPGWIADFVNGLGGGNPNDKIRVKGRL